MSQTPGSLILGLDRLQAAITTVGELTRPPEDTYAQELLDRYLMLRRFLPTFWRTLEFDASPGGRTTLEAVQFLQRIEGRPNASLQAAPRAVIPRNWQRYVLPPNTPRTNGRSGAQVDRPAYTVCVVERLHEALRHHEVFVEPSERWGDPRAKLLRGEQWEGIRPQICHTLGRAMAPEPELARLGQQLEEAYRQAAAHLPTNAALQIEQQNGTAVLNLERLERLEEPESVRLLRQQIPARLPLVHLPELILEVAQPTTCATRLRQSLSSMMRSEKRGELGWPVSEVEAKAWKGAKQAIHERTSGDAKESNHEELLGTAG